MIKKPKIIGTGLSGLVGSRIVELLKDKYKFVDFSLNTNINILDIRQLEDAFQQNSDAVAVIHMAAFTDTNAAWMQKGDKSGLCFQLNVGGTENVLDLCKKYDKFLINISTDFVFDGQKKGSYIETDQPKPIEWYGETKYLAEKLILDSKHKSSIVRISYPYRAKFAEKSDIVRKIIDGFKNNNLYPMFADQIITPTFIDDIAKGIEYFIKKQPAGIFHLVGSTSLSPYEMCLKIAKVFGFDQKLVQKGSLKSYIENSPAGSRPWQMNGAVSNHKVTKLGIKMKTFDEGLKEIKKQMGKTK
jgi:dTDP-4-dehydrorhamnose reductase